MPYAKSLCLIVIASLVSNMQAATLPDDKEPSEALIVAARSAKTFRIVVQQSFGEATTVTLPFGDAIRSFLKSPGLQEVEGDADITFLVKATGLALGAPYDDGYKYSGADIYGSLRVTERSGIYWEASFKKRLDPPNKILANSGRSSPSDAPFHNTFDAFLKTLCGSALTLFGVSSLLSAFQGKDALARVSIVETLQLRTADPGVLDALISTIGDQSHYLYYLQKSTIEALTQMPDAKVSDSLARALKSPSANVRILAAQILSNRKDCCPVEPLLLAFDDPGGNDRQQIDRFRSNVALALGRSKHPLALRRLIAALRDKAERPSIRSSVAEALGNFKDNSAEDSLIAIVKNATEDYSVRGSAVRSLGLIGNPRAVPLLIQSLMDVQFNVCHEAALSLAFFKEARVVDALIRAISKKSYAPGALESLSKLTGQQLKSPDAWQKWWQDNKSTFDQQKQ